MGINSVKPLIDGEEVFEGIEKLIDEAQRWCYLVVWGFDEDVRLSRNGQNDTTIPTTEKLLKQKAVAMLRAGNVPDIKILIWNGLLDDDYSNKDGSNDVGDLAIVTVPWKDVKGLQDLPFLDYMRSRLSAEDENLLLKLLNSYREIQELQGNDGAEVSFPSGIHVAMQKHPIDTSEVIPSFFDGLSKSLKRIFLNQVCKALSYIGLAKCEEMSIMGSHHQKFVLTERGCYIGGLNFHKDYWDSREHLLIDARRDSSDKRPPSRITHCVPPLHDTGAIVRGPVINEVMKTFAMRWDAAVRRRGGYDHLVQILSSKSEKANSRSDRIKYKELSAYLSALCPNLYERQVVGGARYDTVADPAFLADQVFVTETMPKNAYRSGSDEKTEILRHYKQTIATLTGPESFLYMENQYFREHSIAKMIEAQWRANHGHNGPFAYIVITYDPGTAALDEKLGGIFFKDELLRKEMQNLKWMEIKSARTILVKNKDGLWIPAWGVIDPRSDIRFLDDEADAAPENLKTDSRFVIKNAVRLAPSVQSDKTPSAEWKNFITPSGNKTLDTVPSATLRVDEVLTVSDIMAYTFISARETGQKPNNPDGSVSQQGWFHRFLECIKGGRQLTSAQKQFRYFLEKSNIYLHSKCSIFLNSGHGGRHWATVGSANISPHSLDYNGEQDSEMNVWWQHQKEIERFILNLWREHLNDKGLRNADAALWAEKGWKNLFSVMNRRPVDGAVLRLDVVERYGHLA